jgi:hypothetical protein
MSPKAPSSMSRAERRTLQEGPAYILFFKAFPKIPYQISVLLFVTILYGIGAGISQWHGTLYDYASSPFIWLGFLVTTWVTCVLCWAHSVYADILRKIESSFQVDAKEYEGKVEAHVRTVYEDKRWLVASSPGLVLAILATAPLPTRTIFEPVTGKVVLSMLSFPPLAAFCILASCLFAFVSVVGGYLLCEFTSFVLSLSKYKVRLHVAETQRTPRLDVLARFSLRSSETWFVGLAMGTFLFYQGVTVMSSAIYVPFLLLGFLTFIIPQYSLHKGIQGAKEDILDDLAGKIRDEYESGGKDWTKLVALSLLFEEAQRIREWPFSTSTIRELLVSSLVPLGTALFRMLVPL